MRHSFELGEAVQTAIGERYKRRGTRTDERDLLLMKERNPRHKGARPPFYLGIDGFSLGEAARLVPFVEERVELCVADAPAVGAERRNKSAMKKDLKCVWFRELGHLKKREIKVAATQAIEEDAELKDLDVEVDAERGELLGEKPAEGPAEAIGRDEEGERDAMRGIYTCFCKRCLRT